MRTSSSTIPITRTHFGGPRVSIIIRGSVMAIEGQELINILLVNFELSTLQFHVGYDPAFALGAMPECPA